MNLKQSLSILSIMILLFSCSKKQRTYEKIEFDTEYKSSKAIEKQLAEDTVAWKYQISAQEYANNGKHKKALENWDLAAGGRVNNYTASQIDSVKGKYTKVDAKAYIVDQAASHQIVIINEAHHNSFHRVFTKTLLKDLYEKGYNNIGFEALNNGKDLDSTLNERKYPIVASGSYSRSPQFGNLIREALDIGYTVFAYEYFDEGGGEPREEGQAKNISKFIENRPDDKFLIHCGFAHAFEGPYPFWGKAMAARVKEYTGIDPLTINQENYSEKSKAEYNDPLLKAMNIEKPTVLLDQDSQVFKYSRKEAWTDIAVFHPNTEYIENRPNWLFEYGNQQVRVDLQDLTMNYPLMVFAFRKGEDISRAVPVDIVELGSKKENCTLGLKSGDYEIVITNGEESVKFEKEVI